MSSIIPNCHGGRLEQKSLVKSIIVNEKKYHYAFFKCKNPKCEMSMIIGIDKKAKCYELSQYILNQIKKGD